MPLLAIRINKKVKQVAVIKWVWPDMHGEAQLIYRWPIPFIMPFFYFLMLFLPHAFGMIPFSYLCPSAKHPVSLAHCHNPISMLFTIGPFHSFLPVSPLYQLTKLRLNLSKPWSGSFCSPLSSDLPDLVFSIVPYSAGFVYISVVHYFSHLISVYTLDSHWADVLTKQVPLHSKYLHTLHILHFISFPTFRQSVVLRKQAIKN